MEPSASVLIIEDDPTLLRGLADNFELKGFRVSTAADGQTGLQAALTGKPDLILLDIMLPKLNGFEICRQVRESGLTMPIIMLTAKGQEDDIVRGLNLGADDYMTKPFSIRELLARAQAFLRRRRADEPDVHVFGDCRLDLEAHKVFRGGAEVALSPKEFRLLAHFVGRAGRALTRDEIMDSVWGGVLVTSRSVDRCVTTLRGKIEPDPRHPTYIHTIRDVGYRFEMPAQAERPVATPAVQRELHEGDIVGPYRILSLLGRGGMGVVYRAHDARLARDVALKVLPPRLAGDAEAMARFRRETQAIAALSHPAILSVFDVGNVAGLSYAAMELLEGQTLGDRLAEGALDWREAVAIGLAVADGIAATHARGVIHRDIKPSNIFLTDSGGPRILDFGLAQIERVAGDSPAETPTHSLDTRPGSVLGTAGYMAPEQVRGEATDARSDVFSLGCVLCEMMAGHAPFQRETAAETMVAVLNDAPEITEVADRDTPADLTRIVLHCLEKDADRRFQSARDLTFALEGLAGG